MEILNAECLATLDAAIAKAQARMHNPKLDGTNPYFNSRFATLAAVRNEVIPVLASEGVAVYQTLSAMDAGVACTTILAGFGAERTFGPLVIPTAKKDAHGVAAAATYAKRVLLQSVAGVVGDDDDDGNTAVGPKSVKHDPLDREALKVNGEHAKYAEAFKDALANGDVRQVHADCQNEGEEFYRSVWSLLDSRTRSGIKKALQEAA